MQSQYKTLTIGSQLISGLKQFRRRSYSKQKSILQTKRLYVLIMKLNHSARSRGQIKQEKTMRTKQSRRSTKRSGDSKSLWIRLEQTEKRRTLKKTNCLSLIRNNLEMMTRIRKRKTRMYQNVRVKVFHWQTSKGTMTCSLLRMFWSKPTHSAQLAALRRKGNSKHLTTSWANISVNPKLTKKSKRQRKKRNRASNWMLATMMKNLLSLSRVEKMPSRSLFVLFAWS